MWENANLPKYDDSETRLAEISDAVCGERDETCHRLMGRYEDDIAEWWTSGDDRTEASLHQRLCIEREKACCPEFHGGPKCEPCPQDARGFTCGGHGACSYSGYRQKQYPYQCACSPGYIGRACEDCDVGYVRLPGETTCHKCHHTCKDSCTGVTELDCDECADGYYRTPTGKLCLRCNPACRTCTDATEDACLECAPGYARLDGSSTCVDVDECADTEHPACPGEGRQCINIPGAARCVCQPGYVPDGYATLNSGAVGGGALLTCGLPVAAIEYKPGRTLACWRAPSAATRTWTTTGVRRPRTSFNGGGTHMHTTS